MTRIVYPFLPPFSPLVKGYAARPGRYSGHQGGWVGWGVLFLLFLGAWGGQPPLFPKFSGSRLGGALPLLYGSSLPFAVVMLLPSPAGGVRSRPSVGSYQWLRYESRLSK